MSIIFLVFYTREFICFAWATLAAIHMRGGTTALLKKGCALCNPVCSGAFPGFVEKGLRPLQPVCSGAFPPAPPLAIITDKVVGLSYPKFALLATRGLLLKAFMEEQRTILARKTYALDTARWHRNYCVKSAETTSYVQYRLMQQSRVPPRPPLRVSLFVTVCCCKCQTKHYHYSYISAC